MGYSLDQTIHCWAILNQPLEATVFDAFNRVYASEAYGMPWELNRSLSSAHSQRAFPPTRACFTVDPLFDPSSGCLLHSEVSIFSQERVHISYTLSTLSDRINSDKNICVLQTGVCFFTEFIWLITRFRQSDVTESISKGSSKGCFNSCMKQFVTRCRRSGQFGQTKDKDALHDHRWASI